MRLLVVALVLVSSSAFADPPADAPVVDEQKPVIKVFPGHGECSNEAATRDREIEKLATAKELRDARALNAVPVVAAAGVAAVLTAIAAVAILGATGHLR